MDAQRRKEITGWDAREFDGGFDGLRRFADRGFTGAATDGTGWLFMLDGRVVGTVDADLDAFADASGTIYEAPHQALPVLFAMQERGGEKRAQYYTKDTPLSEADDKLSQGGFTGYVELSENVLSGDYYVTYTGGESMAAAFVGNARRLETGEDAFELANDEIGIYTVYEVDLDVKEIPEADGATGGAGAAGGEDSGDGTERADDDGGPGESEDDPTSEHGPDRQRDDHPSDDRADATDRSRDPRETPAASNTDGSAAETDQNRVETTDRDENPPTSGSTSTSESTSASATRGSDGPDGPDGSDEPQYTARERRDDQRQPDGERRRDGESVADERSEGPRSSGKTEDAESERKDVTEQPTAEEPETPTDRRPDAPARPTGSTESTRSTGSTESTDSTGSNGPSDDDDVFSEEAQWRETKSIPALDPSETSERGENPAAGSSARTNRKPGTSSNRGGRSTGSSGRSRPDGTTTEESTPERGSEAGSSPNPRSTARSGSGRAAVSGRVPDEVRERVEELESALSTAESAREEVATERDRLETERDELREELDEVTSERDEIEAERDRLEEELDRLRTEVDRLREQLDRAESRLPDGDRSLSAAEARDGTNLFIRYDSKSGATLEDAHDGAVTRDDLRQNLRIEHHTSFETEGLLVDGEPFESFLRETMEYGFTRWLVEELPFEIGETSNGSALRDLYDALPEVDRAEIGGSVSVVIRENGEETREQRSFDLVLRDRMGNPLFVAELNNSRAPTAGGTLESLVANGGVIGESNEAFAAAFAVTASFFEPDALEAASDAVGGGLFNRSKRKSFVKLSRKRGYHLCLVESREGGFHLTVPDL
ncbi:hypothetical protein [Halorubrum sp. F4]|uniref:DUF7527 domain-containing protein n=1 Tax=Halorubrum sp. F4 TaxID=2989715 RepID=UPI00247FF938|nr:hypothetical protein [Halorubrum sp. F4]